MFDGLEKYKSVIGLTVHVQHATNNNLFSLDSTPFDNLPNHNVSIVSPGLTGSLRLLNKQIIEDAIMPGFAIQMKIVSKFPFGRKNYFYIDLLKGYQISQDKAPICMGGFIKVTSKDG